MKKEMLINVLQSEECRIAIIEDGLLEELYIERSSQESYVGNIYKGKIVNIEPGIQAAFVDFGIGRNGFLHVSDVDPVYYKHLLPQEIQDEMDAEEQGTPPKRDAGRGPRSERGPRREERRPEPAPSDDFGDLGEFEPVAPPPPRRPEAEVRPVTRQPEPPRDDDEEDEFAGGLIDETPEPLAKPSRPIAPALSVPVATTPSTPEPTPSDDDDDGFGEGLLDEESGEPLPDSVAEAPPHEVLPPTKPVPADPKPIAAEEFPDSTGAAWELVPAREKPSGEAEPGDVVIGHPKTGRDAPTEPHAANVDVPVKPVEKDDASKTTSNVRIVSEIASDVESVEPPAKKEGDAMALLMDTPGMTGIPVQLEIEEPKVKKPARGRTKKAKDDEAAAPVEEVEEKKKPVKRRTTKKKTDDDDDKPVPLPGAERRTAAGDDEPEVRPFFFGGAAGDFDPDAPNDRFNDAPRQPSRRPEPREDDYAPPRGGFEAEESPAGRSFEEEFGPPIRTDDDRRGGPRGRNPGGRRDDRGPRRDDRGPRRDDRGPRRDDRNSNGPRGSGAPQRSGPPPRDRGYPRPPIQEIFKRGQEVIIQVIKEAIGTKAPNLSTFISIAGRYLVLMPSLNRVGVSRKIEDVDARKRLRSIMTRLNPPKGVGFIVRTAATERNETELQNDLAYLLRLWQVVARRIKKVAAPVEIYRESDMITRTIRDNFTSDIDTIWVDEEAAYTHASDFLQVVMPRFVDRIKFHADTEPLFNKYRVDDEIAKINSKRIELPQGGSIIIEQTEALVAIDVNSGNYRADNNAEETAFQVNMMAAKEIARQLRLRDLGGVIVNDFIDMRSETHRRKVEETLTDALKRDRARTKILRISQFGIIEMTRQRIQTSLKKRVFNECLHCKGTGYTKTPESVAIEVMRLLQQAGHRSPSVSSVTVTVETGVAFYLLNKKRKDIANIEQRAGMEVQVMGQFGVSPDCLELRCLDQNGNEVRLFSSPPPPSRMGRGPGPRALEPRRPGNLD